MKPMRLISGFLTVGFWTLMSRIAGLVRDILMTRFLGDGPVAEAFTRLAERLTAGGMA